MLIEEVTVDEIMFNQILDGDIEMLSVSGEIRKDVTFVIKENGRQKRTLFANVIESMLLIRHSWIFKKEIMSVIRFSLSGMINIDDKDYPMTTPVKDEIYKQKDSRGKTEVDLKLCPKIVFTSKGNQLIAEYRFLTLELAADSKIQELSYSIDTGNDINVHTLTL